MDQIFTYEWIKHLFYTKQTFRICFISLLKVKIETDYLIWRLDIFAEGGGCGA